MRTKELSMHHLTAADVPVPEFIRLAAKEGYSAVTLFVNNLGYDLPEVNRASVAEARRILDGEGLTVSSTCDFIMLGQEGGGDHGAHLELTAALGARYASAVVGETEDARSVEAIARFSEAAASHGLRTVIEFLLLTPGCPDFTTCDRLVRQVGSENVGILLDITHFLRSGGSVEQLRKSDCSLVEYVHIADGRADCPPEKLLDEVIHERLIPGEGVFPLADILAALPSEAIYEIEAPTRSLVEAGVGAAERLRRHAEGVRKAISTIGASAGS